MELFEGRRKESVGSSRIRGTWIANNWPEAEIFKVAVKYDAIIFQKSYFLTFMKAYKGIKILDMCDPDWLEGKLVKQAIELCDAVTTSSEKLAEFIRSITDKPVVCIPDRMDLKEHKRKKIHEGNAQRVVWFGYSNNHKVVDRILLTLKKLGLGLTIVSDMPYYPNAAISGIDDTWIRENVKNIKYDHESINEEIVDGGDIVINPKLSDLARFKYKSNNKTLTAWALGMPVATNEEELIKFIDPVERQKEADKRYDEVVKDWEIGASVQQYCDILKSIGDNK